MADMIAAQARALYDDALVWDMTLPWLPNYCDEETLPRFHRAGIGVISLTVGGDKSIGPTVAMQQIAHVNRQVAAHPDELVVARSVAEIRAARKAGKTALLFHLQGTNPLAHDAGLVEVFYSMGVRHMLLAYNEKNFVGDGCAERTDAGLSRFGIEVIREMNRVGMLVDGTHTGYRTTMEAMEVCEGPFIFSHSNPLGVFDHYRNIRDDQIKACAKSGGVIGINGLGAFIGDVEALPQTMFRHIDYVAQLVGAQHVGIGLDFVRDHVAFWKYVFKAKSMWPENAGKPHEVTKFVQPEQLVDLADLMLKKGYAEADVRGVLGENFARVCEAVWR